MAKTQKQFLQRPWINLNGTHKETLLQDQVDALEAVRNALEKLRKITPHGRDYPSEESYKKARRQHEERILKLEDVEFELEALAEIIADQ